MGVNEDTGQRETWYEEVLFTDDQAVAIDACSRYRKVSGVHA